MGGLHGRGGRGCGGIPCHHENLGPLGVPGSRMPVQPPGARTSGSLPRARPNLGLHAYLRPAHALQLCIEHGCRGDNMSSLSTAVLVQLYSVSRVRARRIVNWSSLATGFRLSPSTLGRPAPEGLRYRKFASARTCRAPVNTHTDNSTHAGMPCRARCLRALARSSRASSRPARRHPQPSMHQKAIARSAARRSMPAAAPSNKLQSSSKAPSSMTLGCLWAS